ncbi:MAG: argininosuccinate lyase [Chitinispirillaceae bacterium]
MKMWDGRFSKPVDALMDEFNRSLPVDRVFVQEDIEGSIAWARALYKAGVISFEDREQMVEGLKTLLQKAQEDALEFLPSDEDIHMAIERLLVEQIGEAGSRLHSGRSRNDQVATDFRLFVMRALKSVEEKLTHLQQVIYERAVTDKDVIVPGYTHLQQAQPVSLAHYWLSFFFCLQREKSRLQHAVTTADRLPLGSGAVAGSGFVVDRHAIARELGFSCVMENSMDGVASRDFVLESLAALSSLAIHLSRYAEELIIWSSREFGFVELDDAWSTGSSMMPQKKNPDSLELIRGKCGRFIGNYTRFATTLKGIGLTYYKDLQEDKEPLLDSLDQMDLIVRVFAEIVRTIQVKKKNIRAKLDPFLLATDVADYLVRKGIPFRKAHKIVGKLVGWCVENDRDLTSLTVKELKVFDSAFDDDVSKLFDWQTALAGRDIEGGTGPQSVRGQLKKAEEILRAKETGQ